MIVEAVVEDARGATRRHAWDPAARTWREWQHPHARSPWPASYGFLPGTHNPADGDELDVIILSTDALSTGTRLAVRVVGLCPRPDGDHKVLAVAVADPRYGEVRCLADVPAPDLGAIERWFQEWTTITGWEDEHAAERLVAAGRGPAAHAGDGIDTGIGPGAAAGGDADVRYREGILKVEHGILPGLKDVLLELTTFEAVSSIVPGRIYATHARPGGTLTVRVTATTATGVKLLARLGSSVQEVFVVSDQPADLKHALATLTPAAPRRTRRGGARPGRPARPDRP